MLYGSVGRVGLRALLGSVAFTPLSLFAAGEQGVWLDNSDFTTLFQDAAGTTPVTGYEQFVGLRLDKSKGLVLGSELVTNGTFNANVTGWSTQANVSISWVSGELRAVSTSTGTTAVYQDITTVAGRTYKLSITVRQNTGNTLLLVYNGAFATLIRDYTVTAPTTNTTTSLVFTATGATTRIGFAPLAVATAFADNISVRELPGNHAYQTTTTARAVLSARYNLLTQTEAFDDGVWTAVNTKNVNPNTDVAPDGTNTADTITDNSAVQYQGVQQTGISVANGVEYKFSLYVKKTTGVLTSYPSIHLGKNNIDNSYSAVMIDTTNGTLTDLTGGVYTVPSAKSITSVGDYWLVSITTAMSASTTRVQFYPSISINGSTLTASAIGSSVIWGADLRVANESSALPAYQRVGAAVNGTSTSIGTPDYDTVGFPAYLRYDGGDWYQTNSIDFSTLPSGAPTTGGELVSNGDFSNGLTGWSLTGGYSPTVSSGALVFNGGSSTGGVFQSCLTAGKYYQVTYTVVSRTSGAFFLGIGTSYGPLRTAAGTYTETRQAASDNLLRVYGDSTNFVGSIDNISVKEIDPLYYPDKMSVFTGVRKLSDDQYRCIVELSANNDSNNGTFAVFNPNLPRYDMRLKGDSLYGSYSPETYTAPDTAILTLLGNLGGSTLSSKLIPRVDALVEQENPTAGTIGGGNFGNYPLYIGARAGTSLYYNGREYETIVLGRAVTATELANTEGYMETQTFGKDMSYVYADELTTATGDLITAADGDQIYMTVTYS